MTGDDIAALLSRTDIPAATFGQMIGERYERTILAIMGGSNEAQLSPFTKTIIMIMKKQVDALPEGEARAYGSRIKALDEVGGPLVALQFVLNESLRPPSTPGYFVEVTMCRGAVSDACGEGHSRIDDCGEKASDWRQIDFDTILPKQAWMHHESGKPGARGAFRFTVEFIPDAPPDGEC